MYVYIRIIDEFENWDLKVRIIKYDFTMLFLQSTGTDMHVLLPVTVTPTDKNREEWQLHKL
jgi:hypothetical protein